MLYHTMTRLCTQGCLCRSDVADDSTFVMLCEGSLEHCGVAILRPPQMSTLYINLPGIETTNQQEDVVMLMHCFYSVKLHSMSSIQARADLATATTAMQVVPLTVIGWPTDMIESSRTAWILAVGVPVGDSAPVMTTCSSVSSRGANATRT